MTTTVSSSTIGSVLDLKLVDLAIVRSVLEVFMRPIDGTLKLKSNNYVMLEAGKGKAQVPLDRYAPKYRTALKMESREKQKVYGKIAAYIKLINSKIDQYQKDYYNLKQEAYDKKKEYKDVFSLCWINDQVLPNVVTHVYPLISIEDFEDNDEHFLGGTLADTMAEITIDKLVENNGWNVPKKDPFYNLDELKRHIQPIAQAYGRAIVNLKSKVDSLEELFDDYTIVQLNQSVLKTDQDADTQWIDDVFRTIMNQGEETESRKFIDRWYERYGNDNATVHFMHDNDKESPDDPFYTNLFLSKRRMIAKFLLALRNHANNGVAIPGVPQVQHNKYFDVCYSENELTDDYLTNKWKNVACLKSKAPGKAKEIWDIVTEYLNLKNLRNPWKAIYDKNLPGGGWAHQVWNDKNGQILMSSDKDDTYFFDKGAIKKLDQISWSNKDLLRSILKSIK